MSLELIQVNPSGQELARKAFNLPQVRIGRSEDNDYVLEDRAVSRRHVVLGTRSGALWVENLSNHGVILNGTRMNDEAEANPGDYLQIGPFLFRLGMTARVHPHATPAKNRVSPHKTSAEEPPGEPVVANSTEKANHPPAGHAAGDPSDAIPTELKKQLHTRLLDVLSIKHVDLTTVRAEGMRQRAEDALQAILQRGEVHLSEGVNLKQLIKEVLDEALGLGPLQDLLDDDDVSEIMVVARDQIFVERAGRIEESTRSFSSDEAVMAIIERIVTPLGRRIDESTPLVDARLKDGSRVNAIIPPLALKGPTVTIRKFRRVPLELEDLVRYGSLNARMGRFLTRCVQGRKNILISGGTGSGKTTLLNLLSSFIPADERVVTIEDAAELRLRQRHVVSLETRPPNVEGRGEYSIRDLVRNALRMRPDRIIVGECRGPEALDMLQAMNTGHEGSMTTGHANTPEDMLARLETMVLMAGLELPLSAVRRQLASAIDVIVQQARFSDGSRRVTHITEVLEVDEDGSIRLEDIFRYRQRGVDDRGKIEGDFAETGYLPSFIPELALKKLIGEDDYL